MDLIIDLDRSYTWPEVVRTVIKANLDALMVEREASKQHDLSSGRWRTPAPSQAITQKVLSTIKAEMLNRRIRVFHATRLIDFEEVKKNGLLAMRYDERFARLRQLLGNGCLPGMELELENLLSNVPLDEDFFASREKQVWFTPLRRALHDGGCDIFFEQWGGEAVQRIAANYNRKLESLIQNIGSPAVVVANIPAYGCCALFGDLRLAPTIIELALEEVGAVDCFNGGWDVLIESDVPPDWIENILYPTDPYLSDH
jgi:hypothetical protein